MPKLIMFLGVQLSGKSTLAKEVAKIKNLPLLSIDDMRLDLYGHLSGPKDWLTPELKQIHDSQTKQAYEDIFGMIRVTLGWGLSLIVEMPHLGNREEFLKNLITETETNLKMIWCYISQDSDEEIQKRINLRPKDAAPIRLEDYRMFKNKIKKPETESLAIDTSRLFDECLKSVINYLHT